VTYRGPLRAVIVDWAGTVVDFGSCAPVHAFREVFRRARVELTTAEVRTPMGSAKRDHIAAILAMPEVANRWQAAHGTAPGEADIDLLYTDFIPAQIAVIPDFAALIPGTLEAATAIRERGLRIGSTTGYSRAMMDLLVPLAARQGFTADHVATGDKLPSGRPAPWMCFENMERLSVYPPAACVKIGDTAVDIEEGLNAGMWTIGVTATGNELGLSLAEYESLERGDRKKLLAEADARLTAAGAHHIAESIIDVPALLDVVANDVAEGRAP
jgi:phosphonoacetaldehyde hydrolase